MWGRISHVALLPEWLSLLFLGLYISSLSDVMMTSCLHGCLPVCVSLPQFPLSQEHWLYWIGSPLFSTMSYLNCIHSEGLLQSKVTLGDTVDYDFNLWMDGVHNTWINTTHWQPRNLCFTPVEFPDWDPGTPRPWLTFPKQVLSLGELGCVHEGHEFPQDGSITETLTSYLNSLTLCLCVYNVIISCLASFSLGNWV